ncbi:unnamed protein product [Nezara viridula]|uniref:Uncharacterized protein n=1 Tax=Nezara viridula TaxID=85310 RepID=A0A9P0MK60_NEZVI|nr:unnamed protein product [Nezara viridula]
MAPQSSIFVKKRVKTITKNYQDDIFEPVVKPLNDTVCWKPLGFPAEFHSRSQGQINSAVAAKEHSRVHLCLGLALRKPWSQPTRLSALVRNGEDGIPQSTP